jgi:hypothetical protein
MVPVRSDAVATVLLAEWALRRRSPRRTRPPLLRGEPYGSKSGALSGRTQGLQGPPTHLLPLVHNGEHPRLRCLELRRQS